MFMSDFPNDPIILLSFINTKLRDNYSSLELLCDDLNLDIDTIKTKLSSIGYVYDRNLNKFV